jgi:hypothetical protein
MQEALDTPWRWAEKWGMQFNLEKCKIMHIGRNNPQYEYKKNETVLSTAEEGTDVGVWITKSLKSSMQCQKAATRGRAVLNQITRNFHYRDRHTFMKPYKQYVRPCLEFASPAWSPWQQGDKDVLEEVQEKAVKMVSGLKGMENPLRCAELNLETLEKRREGQDMSLVHNTSWRVRAS